MPARYIRRIIVLGMVIAFSWNQPELASAMCLFRHCGLRGRKFCDCQCYVCGATSSQNTCGCLPEGEMENSSPTSPPKTVNLICHVRRMMEMQQEVYEDTVRLEKLAEEQPGRNLGIETERLSIKQRRLIADVEKMILILREDGTAVALPVALEQIREDMQQVAGRLAEGKVDRKITQAIEDDIIEASKKSYQPGRCRLAAPRS